MFNNSEYNYNDDWTNTNPEVPEFDYNSFYRAIVESIDDPEHIGRIKVRIPYLHSDADVSTLPYAYPAIFAGLGNQVGQFILPPVGSIVFVAFEYSNEHRPIYFGGIPTRLGDSDQEQYYGPRVNKGKPRLVTSDDLPLEYTGSQYIIYKSPSGSIIYIDDNDYNPEIVVKDSVGQELRFTSNDIKDTELDGAIYLKHDSKNYIKVSQDEIILCVAGVEYKAPFSGGGGGTTDYDLLIHKPILNTSNNTSLSTNSAEEIKGTISLHKVSKTGSYNDLLNKPTIPTKTSQLTNDSNYATIDIIPTKVSDLQNDAGYITGYTETDPTVPTHVKNITQQNITDWNNKSTFSGDYNDLTNKPTIPDELKDLSSDSTHRTVTDAEKTLWNNKSDFSGDYNDLTNKPSIPSKVSDLVNDEGYTDNIGTITEVQANGTSISTSGVANIPAATTETYGVTKLSSSTNSTSNSLAATPSAVKSAYDLANTANTQASTNATNITSLQTNKADKSELPTKTSDLTNDSGFITSADVPAQVQSDWNQTTTTAKDFIKNKPNLSVYETKSNKVAISSTATADQYPNAKSVYDFVTDSISTIPQGLKIPVSISKESDLPTTASNGDYYYIQNMDTTAPGHTGRAWYNNQWYKVYDQYNSMDGISIVQSGGGSWQVSTEWLHGVLPVDSSLSSTSINPVQNKVINTALGNKVDKVSGKGLSTNDLTDSLKTKYDEAANKIDQIIAEGGEPNVIEIVKVNNTALTPDANKAVNVTVPTKTSDLTNDSGYTSNTGTITGIKMNGASKGTSGVVDLGTVVTDVSNKQDKITSTNKLDYSLLSNTPTIPTVNNATLTIQKNGTLVKTFTANASTNVTANIEVPTKTSDLTNDSGFVEDSNYVHTDNNYTTTEKNKLSGIESNAQVNKLEKILVNGVQKAITNKGVDIDVPTKVSDLINDRGFIDSETQADWNESDSTSAAYINNKPDLSNYAAKSDIVQSDWNITDSNSKAYIKNKPDLSNLGKQSDWNVTNTSDLAYIKNKPTFKTINGSPVTGSGNIVTGTVISSDDSVSDIVTVTSAEFDAMILAGTVDPDTLYNVTDGNEQDKVVYNTVPVGTGVLWFGDLSTVPENFVVPDGSIVNISDYPDLFEILGTKYGGNGTTTFGLPNLKGRVVVMTDPNDTDFDTVGNTGGEKTHTLTTSEMPSHTHTQKSMTNPGDHTHNTWKIFSFKHASGKVTTTCTGETSDGRGNPTAGAGGHTHTVTLNDTGGGEAHNNLQPYIVAYYIIKAKKGVYTESLRRLDSEVFQMKRSEQEVEATFTITSDYQFYSTPYIVYPSGFNKDNTYILGCKFTASNINYTEIKSVVMIMNSGTVATVSDSCLARLDDDGITLMGRSPFTLSEGPDVTVKLLLKKFG